MSMVVAQMKKMKSGNLTGIGNHNQRKTKNHSNKEIDEKRRHLNYDIVDRTKNYKTDIEKFINENKSTTRAIRKDAVLVNDWIISSDRDFFDNLSVRETSQFFHASKDFFAKKFGDENIRYAMVHMDETTPHMHLGIVPFDEENKLSAKRVFNRQTLIEIQEELPNYLQELGFDIERGRKGSKRKNLTVPEYKEMIKEKEEIKKEVIQTEKVLNKEKQQLKAYLEENNVDSIYKNIKAKKETKTVKVPNGDKLFFGLYEIKDKIDKETGNYILSKEDYSHYKKAIDHAKKLEPKLEAILNTDYEQERMINDRVQLSLIGEKMDLEDEIKELKRENSELREDNADLRSLVRDLRDEIKLIYKTTKGFLKERVDDISAFKSMFKLLTNQITERARDENVTLQFKKAYDKDHQRVRTRVR